MLSAITARATSSERRPATVVPSETVHLTAHSYHITVVTQSVVLYLTGCRFVYLLCSMRSDRRERGPRLLPHLERHLSGPRERGHPIRPRLAPPVD